MAEQSDGSAPHFASAAPADRESGTIRSLGFVATYVAKVGAGIVGLTAFGYAIGYNAAEAYLSAFGASWAVALLSPSQILRFSQSFLFPVVLMTMLGTAYVATGQWASKAVVKWAWRFLIAAPILALVTDLPSSDLPVGVVRSLLILSSLFWTLAIAGIVIELVVGLRDSALALKGSHLWLLYALAAWGLAQAPQNQARAKAHLDSDPIGSTLPHATLQNAPQDDWRLLSAIGDRLLLVTLACKQADIRLQVVDILSVQVRSTKPDSAKVIACVS